ncbi:Tubulin/FtsZ family, GTPase domain-containing protein [Dunaliella salina]|uniref:Tubulin/FtsZ family, GTPase domain-containing protein n=1 Tax=Dunaliella salina TaxID=3046 RepID=A0ABQ7H7L7_DUNSA|nr:Tubulin/FtsZ family, GTPase domain-containing protein [Dunaliella salina]|eukprot:KAF5842818.1 Tubulin/FtsZ family, GTPase domain-containing protein [Dunaliella salina]
MPGPLARTDGWQLLQDVSWTVTSSPDEASFYLSSDDPSSEVTSNPFRPLTHDEKTAQVQPHTTFPDGSWRVVLGNAAWFQTAIDGRTHIEPGATVQDVLTKISRLAADMEAPFQGTLGGCFGDHVYYEGLREDEHAGVYHVMLGEHAAYNSRGGFDEPLSSFFRNVDTRVEPHRNLPVGDGSGPIRTLKARSVVVDMECGVINEMLKGPLGDVLDTQQLISDVSGAGNNWGHGHHVYGPQYHEQLLDTIRSTVEDCDSLQSFLLLHSLGGGTGSGVGTYILELLADEYPDVFRFTASVFPSEDDDVITSPYNAMLSAAKLVEHADCSKPFDAMNGIAASMLLNMTSSMRFEGSLNVDLNDITMNLVPYPQMHFLISSMSPLGAPKDVAKLAAPRTMDQVFTDVFARENQLIRADPRHGTYLACGLLMRGAATISDVNRNVARLKPSLRMAHWNSEGFKLGLCSKPPVGVPNALLCLANNSAITNTFNCIRSRFDKLFKRRFYTHHYEQYMDLADFQQAAEAVTNIAAQYAAANSASQAPPIRRLRPHGLSFLS